ncbi:MAG: hypothetical protein JOZ99_15310, partial [Actinobacteria bacterium]|nr:hypothetical protein [Actinomycetota bacterium]
LGSFQRPLPGSSPEFWPEDWRTYAGSDAYGWGATTANLLIRHLFGVKESTDTAGWVLDLTPAFPAHMLVAGRQYTIERMQYRHRRFDLSYVVDASGRVQARLDVEGDRRELDLQVGERVTVRL